MWIQTRDVSVACGSSLDVCWLCVIQSETDKKLEAMKEMRVKMKELASESRGKEVLCKQLVGPLVLLITELVGPSTGMSYR